MAEKKWHSIQVVKGSGGYGGPLTITPTEQKHKFIYVTGVTGQPSWTKLRN